MNNIHHKIIHTHPITGNFDERPESKYHKMWHDLDSFYEDVVRQYILVK